MDEFELLFVYGTLRPPRHDGQRARTFNYPKVLPFLIDAVPARLTGGDLYDLGSFPAAVPGAGVLIGDLLTIEPAAFDVLDPLEGHPEVYKRERVRVVTDAGSVTAWIYWAPQDLTQLGSIIESGDWLANSSSPG